VAKRTCTSCGCDKNVDDFTRSVDQRTGHVQIKTSCRPCRADALKKERNTMKTSNESLLAKVHVAVQALNDIAEIDGRVAKARRDTNGVRPQQPAEQRSSDEDDALSIPERVAKNAEFSWRAATPHGATGLTSVIAFLPATAPDRYAANGPEAIARLRDSQAKHQTGSLIGGATDEQVNAYRRSGRITHHGI
jgi:hypothetical protein